MRFVYLLAGLTVMMAAMAALLVFIPQTSGAEANICNDGNSICILIDEILPETYELSIQNYAALEVYQVTPENWTYMEFNVAQLPAGMTPQVLLGHIKNIESNLLRNKAQTAIVPLIYPASNPAPLCLRDSDGSLNGLYSVNDVLDLVKDDPNCFGICQPGENCPPTLSPENVFPQQQI